MSYLGPQFLASAEQLVGASNNHDFKMLHGANALRVLLEVTAVAGAAPTLDAKVQFKDAFGTYRDIVGGALSQQNAVGAQWLEICPSLTPVANETVSALLGGDLRIVVTAVDTVDYNLSVEEFRY